MKIVDAGWETAEPIIVTPAFARCAYSNDVEIALDPGKLTVNLSRDNRELSSELPKIAGCLSLFADSRYAAHGLFDTDAVIESPRASGLGTIYPQSRPARTWMLIIYQLTVF